MVDSSFSPPAFMLRTFDAGARDYRLGPRSEWTLGTDLGQSIDWTTLGLVERRVFPTGEIASFPGMHEGATNWRRQLQVRYVLKAVERLPKGLNYYDVAAHMARRKAQVEGSWGRCATVFDEGGARGTGEIIRREIPDAVSVVLTAGEEDNHKSTTRWTTPKASMVISLLAAIESGDLAIADGLSDKDEFIKHMVDLRRKVSVLGHFTFNAVSGSHDDHVTSAGLAWWWARRPIDEARAVKILGWG